MSIMDKNKELVEQLVLNDTGDNEFRPDNVMQAGNPKNRAIISKLMDMLLLKGSRINGKENLEELFKLSKEGKSCLILMEHYSNFDYPLLYKMIDEQLEANAEDMYPIAGMKLTEDDKRVAAFSNAYNKIVIYPNSYIEKETDPVKKEQMKKDSAPFNIAAVKALTKAKNSGKVILVFPAGTRVRPWAPNSKKGVREMFSYIKTFDYICFISKNGNILPPHESDKMDMDSPRQDLIILTAEKPISGRKYVNEVLETLPDGEDQKQYVVSQVMKHLFELHDKVEIERLKEKELIV
ncbi:MAG: 1-acyl-sn-glycerol-3-phosphate acyltransferase [Spirochaetales bacterium]|nr:1-acyl-sn-glycerol-3-phosphate acyltransferase [Spirochaetales bacterium]